MPRKITFRTEKAMSEYLRNEQAIKYRQKMQDIANRQRARLQYQQAEEQRRLKALNASNNLQAQRQRDAASARLREIQASNERAMKRVQMEKDRAAAQARAADEERRARIAKQKAELEAKKKARQDAHDKFLKDMEHKDKEQKLKLRKEQLVSINKDIEALDQVMADNNEKKETTAQNLKETEEKIQKMEDDIKKFPAHKEVELGKVNDELQLKTAQDEFYEADKQIKEAIAKTGQVEENVGRFLGLTHGLLDATLSSTANSNKLNAEISTFGKLIKRECQDKLTVEQYFGNDNNLVRFIPILASEKITNMSDLRRKDEDEFDELYKMIEDKVKALPVEKDEDEKEKEDEKKEEEEEKDGKTLMTEWKLSKFWPAMEEGGCADVDDWQDLDDADFKELGFKGMNIKKFKRKYKEHLNKNSVISSNEKRLLEQICLEPETWAGFEKEQQEAVKEGLGTISPLLGKFFKRIHSGIKQCERMLTYDKDLNKDQLQAIEQTDLNTIPPLSIKYKIDDDDEKSKDVDDEGDDAEDTLKGTDDPEDAMRKQWDIGTKVQFYSVSHKRWMDAEIVSVTTDDIGEWLQLNFANDQKEQVERHSDMLRVPVDTGNKLAVQSRQLMEASIVSIDVTKWMMVEFNQNTLAERALVLATGVEGCTMQIIKAQCMIRQSVLMAKEILTLRPAHMKDETKKLWDVVDEGVVNIFKNAIEMVKVSSEYFGYFLRFQQAFKFYESNADKSMMISMAHLNKDIGEFEVFQENFDKTVKKLSDEAMGCIQKCVGATIGAENFAKFRNSREEKQQKWLTKKKQYDAKSVELDSELDKLENKLITEKAALAGLEVVVETLKEAETNNKEQRGKYLKNKEDLNKMKI